MKLKIRSQLVLAFSVVLGMVLISSTVVFWKASDVRQKLDRFKETRIPLLMKSSAMELGLLRSRSDLRRVVLFVATGKTDKARAYKQQLDQDWTGINSDFSELPEMSRHFVLQENKDRVSKLETELPLLHQEQNDIVDRALAEGPKGAASVDDDLVKNVEAHGVAIRELCEGLSGSAKTLVADDLDSQIKSQSQTQWVLTISTLLSLAIGIGIAFVLSGKIVGGLAPVVARLNAIASSDLSGTMLNEELLARQDELGELAVASKKMTENLRGLLGGITGGVHTLSASATELSAVSKQTAAAEATMSEKANGVAVAAEEASANTLSIAAGMEESSSSLSSVWVCWWTGWRMPSRWRRAAWSRLRRICMASRCRNCWASFRAVSAWRRCSISPRCSTPMSAPEKQCRTKTRGGRREGPGRRRCDPFPAAASGRAGVAPGR
jgi:HAMP domain-containing protein